MAAGPGDLINVRFTRWGGGRHWEFTGNLLGRDRYGAWVGSSTGTALSRPGNAFQSGYPWVTLFPDWQPWVASFRDTPQTEVVVYVDITTAPTWTESEVSIVDLDLDVLLMRDGALLLKDEDEFNEHRLALSYPPEVVDLARRTAEDLLTAVGSRI